MTRKMSSEGLFAALLFHSFGGAVIKTEYLIMLDRALCSMFILSVALASPPPASADDSPDPAKVVNTFEQLGGVHKGMRRNHVKGGCAEGSFVGAEAAQKYSSSPLFSGQSVAVIARFSLDGPDLGAADASRGPRSMALQFHLPNGELHQTAMLNTPVFLAATPQSLLDFLQAHLPDPTTGKPDPAKLAAYADTHPDNKPMSDWLETHNPPPTYTNATYYSVDAFKFVNGKAGYWVKWRFEPQDGIKALSDAELAAASHDFLLQRLTERTRKGPVKWDMIVTIGEKGDSIDNPTVVWPAGRKEFNAGTLTLTKAGADAQDICEGINYDPNVLSTGIEPSPDDPILAYRSAAYAESFSRRHEEKVNNR
jgi:catalase